MQFSPLVRSARANATEAAIGPSAILELRTGPEPATLAAASTGTLVAKLFLPVDWAAAAVAGVKGLSGVWQTLAALATGTPGHFRIFASDGTTCGIQGSVSETGDGGELTLDIIDVTIGQIITISSFTITEGNL